MITLNLITMKMGVRTLFEDVTLTFNEGCRYALTGPNGSGKSTLMKIIMKEMEPTSGSVSLPPNVGFLRQDIDSFKDARVIDVVIMGNRRLWEAMEERDHLYEQEIDDAAGMRLAELEGVIAEEDGYSAEAEAEILLEGIGIEKEHFETKLANIPTGHQFRVLLCQALFGKPAALLLDEPTNHLDLESIHWLESFLYDYPGTLVITSHDRHFLNTVATHCADIDYETLIIYPGNYDQMTEAKIQCRASIDRENKQKEKKIAQLKEFVQRFGSGSKASQARSRQKEISRLEPTELKKSNISRPYIRFHKPEKQTGRIVYTLENVSKSYDSLNVIENFSLEVRRGDKIGIMGNNGRGKTTLIKLIAGMVEANSGMIEAGHNVELGYFPQKHDEVVDKSGTMTIMDWLRARLPSCLDQELRDALGKLLFGGDDAFKNVATLSGGETARLLLANFILSKNNILVMDEPNNHLDLESVSALSWALENYDGTVVLAAHDRDLLQNVCNRIIAFEADGIHVYEGNLEEYLHQSRPNER